MTRFSFKKSTQKPSHTVRNNLYMLGLIWKIDRFRVIGEYLTDLLTNAIWVFYSVIFMRYLFGSNGVERSFHEAMVFLWSSLAVLAVTIAFLNWFWHRYTCKSNVRLHRELNRLLFDKARSVDISCYESPAFYSDYTKATTEAFDRAQSVLNVCADLTALTLSSIYVMATMLSITPWSIFFIVFPLVGNLVFGRRVNHLEYERDQARVPFQRRYDYVNRVVYLQKFAGELRLTGVMSVLEHTYDTAYHGVLSNIERFWKRLTINGCLRDWLMYPFSFQGMWLVAAFFALVTKSIGIGDFVVLSSAVVSSTHMLRRLTSRLTDSYKNGLFINNLKNFLQYTPKIDERQGGLIPTLPIKTLQLKNVSFRYDGQEKDALSHINLTFQSGKKVAIVGLNGSGKSTLVKLIMRLYDPREGVICYGGVDIREYDLKAYRALIGAAFQDFALFSLPVIDNVLLQKPKNNEDRARAIEALKESGVYEKLLSLPSGVNSVLTREFDDNGAVLSGGEQQKIAVARAFAKDSPIVILDEPSSALDPIAEHQMMETILRLCDRKDARKGKIAIIISHRLSSAATADDIVVLQDGRVVEQGQHDALMKAGGMYADLFRKQAESYLATEREVASHA